MRIVCSKHGTQAGVVISPDLGTRRPKADISIVSIRYEFDGDIAWAFYVSKRFADEHGLVDCIEPLPDVPGEWVHELDCCCVECFKEFHHGTFNEQSAWVPKECR